MSGAAAPFAAFRAALRVGALLAGPLAVPLAAPLGAQTRQFAGAWRNVDARTRGVTALQIDTAPGGRIDIRLSAACVPADCPWGPAPAVAYGPTPRATLARSADALTVIFVTGFAEDWLLIRPAPGGRLRLDRFRRYTDASGRGNTRDSAVFERAASGGPPRPPGPR